MRRLPRSLFAVATAVVVLFAGLPAATAAGPGDISTNPGQTAPGSTSGLNGDGLSCRDYKWGALDGQINKPYLTRDVNCMDAATASALGISRSWRWEGDHRVCPTGWDVWYFWGNKAKPAAGWAYTRINFNDKTAVHCGFNYAEGRVPGRVFYAHPDMYSSSTAVTDLFRSSTGKARALYGERADEYDPYASLGGRFVATAPLRRGGEACTNYADDNPTAAMLSNAAVKASYDAAIASAIAAGFSETQALTALGLRGTKDNYRADGVPCSSTFDFKPSTSGATNYVGACYIPTTGYVRWEASSNGDDGAASYKARPRIRYDNRFNGYATSVIVPGVTDLSGAWRTQIRNEIKSRKAALGDGFNAYMPGFYIAGTNTPVSSSTAENTPLKSLDETGKWAAEHARCVVDTLTTTQNSTKTQISEPPSGITIDIKAPDYGQVGGKTRQAKIVSSVQTTQLRCGDSPCDPSRVRITGITYTLSVTAKNGYRECRPNQQLNCDFRIISRSTPPGPIQNEQYVIVEFYNATQADQALHIEILNPKATYEYDETTTDESCSRQQNPADPTQDFVVCVQTTAVITHYGNLDISYAKPFDLGVISAVQQPGSGTPLTPPGSTTDPALRGGYLFIKGGELGTRVKSSTSTSSGGAPSSGGSVVTPGVPTEVTPVTPPLVANPDCALLAILGAELADLQRQLSAVQSNSALSKRARDAAVRQLKTLISQKQSQINTVNKRLARSGATC